MFYCLQPLLDYWLRHVTPSDAEQPAALLDLELRRAAEAVALPGMFDDTLIARRIRDEGGTVSIDALSHDAGAELADDGRRDTGFRAPAIDALRDALDALPERDRKLLTACFLQKRRYDEIAEEIGVRENSIGQLLHRAKKKLRKRLGGEKFLETLSGSILALLSLFGPGSGPSP